jgi:hypothetical protein
MFLSGTDFWRHLDMAYSSVPGSGGSNPLHAIPCVHELTNPLHATSVYARFNSVGSHMLGTVGDTTMLLRMCDPHD